MELKRRKVRRGAKRYLEHHICQPSGALQGNGGAITASIEAVSGASKSPQFPFR